MGESGGRGGRDGSEGWVGVGEEVSKREGGLLVADLFGGHTDKKNTGKNERTLASIRGVRVCVGCCWQRRADQSQRGAASPRNKPDEWNYCAAVWVSA